MRKSVQITLYIETIDDAGGTYQYSTLAGARDYAHKRLGEHPEIGTRYAISSDGVVKCYVEGTTLDKLFPERQE